MKSLNMTIRMGAAHWDATVLSGPVPVTTDFRKLDREARRRWYGEFMSSVRKMLRDTTPATAKPRFNSAGYGQVRS